MPVVPQGSAKVARTNDPASQETCPVSPYSVRAGCTDADVGPAPRMTAICAVMEENVTPVLRLKLALVASAVSSDSPALAQDIVTYPVTYPDEPVIWSERRNDTIVVSGTPQPRILLPASVATLSTDDLERLQLPSLADALALEPGITVTRNGPVGGFTGLRIRGADATQTLVVIDGVRVSDPTSPGGGFDFGSLLSGGVARVDVLRGANSVVWGSDAIGGVVLVETGGRNGVSADYGSHDTKRIDGHYRFDAGPVSLNLGAGWFGSDGISAARSGTEPDGFRQYRGHIRASADIADGLSVAASLIHADSRLDLDGFAPPTFAFGDTAEFQKAKETYASARVEHRWGDVVQSLSLGVADINRDTFDPVAHTGPGFAARGRSERVSWQGRYNDSGDPLSAIVGLDREWSRSTTASAFSADRGSTAISGAFAHVNLRLLNGLRLGAGARVDDHRRFGSDTSLSAHALYEVLPMLALRGGYSEGFKTPTLFQLSPTPAGFGNPALKPEESRGWELGCVLRRSERRAGSQPVGIRLEASLFRRDSRNLIDFVPCTGPAAPPICGGGTRPFGTYANVDRARAEGGEIDVTLWPAPGWSVTAGYAHIATRDRSIGQSTRGNRLARRPVHSGSAAVDYATNGFAVGATVQLVGDSFDDAGNRVRLDGYALVMVRGQVALSEGLELFGRIENLFDSRYETVAGYATYGRTASIGLRARL